MGPFSFVFREGLEWTDIDWVDNGECLDLIEKVSSTVLITGGAVVSWLVRSSPWRAVRVQALAGDTVLCSWTRHFTLIVPLFTQVYKWVPANCWGKPNKLRGNYLRWTSIQSRGSRNTPSRFMLQKPGISSSSYEPVGSKASFFTVLIKRVSQIVSLQHMIISLLLGRYLGRHATLLPWSCVTILKTASKETYT